MRTKYLLWILCLVLGVGAQAAIAQTQKDRSDFGPVVRAYLGYLENEQEVVDDRASRHEVNRAYYIRNSNRIRALRQIAVKIAQETENDYLPELEAAARDELGNLFEAPPKAAQLRVGEVYSSKFRYLGSVRSRDLFYIFARLDPYEQAELMAASEGKVAIEAPAKLSNSDAGEARSRPRRVGAP